MDDTKNDAHPPTSGSCNEQPHFTGYTGHRDWYGSLMYERRTKDGASFQTTLRSRREKQGPIGLGALSKGSRTIREVRWQNETSHVEGEFIDWPHPEIPLVEESLPAHGSLKGWIPPSLSDKLFQGHLWRLKLHLDWWEETFRHRVLDPARLIRRNLLEGPEFANELDDLIKYTYRWETGLCCMYSDNWDSYREDTKGFDSFFPPSHLIPFRRPETDDIYLVLEDPPPLDDDLLLRYKAKVREFVKPGKILPELDDVDRLKLFGGTKTFDPSTLKSRTRTEQRSHRPLIGTTDEFLFKYAFVQKTAAEDRAAVLTSQETLNTMYLLKLSLETVRDCPVDVMGVKDFSWLPRWLGNDSYNYLMSDLRKCGLTFPRNLFNATMDVLEEYYPNSIFGLGKIAYANARININGEWRPMTNGLNLGMMNEYVSFMMGCLVSLWLEEENYAAEALMYNDDQVLRFPKEIINNQQDMADVGLAWDKFMERAGCSVHKKKPFWSNRGVFLETYGNPQYSWKLYKTNTYVGNLFWALLATNIVEAKEYVAGVMDSLSDFYRERAKEVLTTVITLWGYEFAPKEVSFSYPIGWVRERNEDSELTLLSEIYDINTLDKVQLGLVQVASVEKPVAYSSKMLECAKHFNKHYKFFTDAICNDSVPSSVKRLMTAVKPPYLGLRKKAVAKVYSDWKDLRRRAYLKGKTDPAIIIKGLAVSPKEYLLPDELILGRTTNEGPLELTYSDILDEDSVSIKEYIRFAQLFGQFEDIKVWNAVSDHDIMEKVGKYLSFPYLESEFCMNLAQQYSREDIRYILQKFGYAGAQLSASLFKGVRQWRPTFIPGKGTIVRYSECLECTLRVSRESWELASSLFPQYWIELAYTLDQAGIGRDEIYTCAEDVYWTFHTSFGLEKETRPESVSARDFFSCSEGRSENESFHTAEERGQDELLVDYLKYQIAGRFDQLADQLDQPFRIEARMTNLDSVFGASKSFLDELDDSDDAGLGIFETDEGDHG